jgi:hypothetical protein
MIRDDSRHHEILIRRSATSAEMSRYKIRKLDPDVPKWLKIVAAVVTIVAAIVGLCFTSYQTFSGTDGISPNANEI